MHEAACIVCHDICDVERELVLRASVIEIMEDDTDSDLTVLLGDEDDISQPVQVLFFPDESEIDKFSDFALNILHDIRTEAQLLLVRLGFRNVELVGCHHWVQSKHVFITLGKDIDVLLH